MAAAQKEVERVAQSLVQSALDLDPRRQTRSNEVVLADEKETIGRRALEIQRIVEVIGKARREAGDLSDIERETLQIEVARAEQDLISLQQVAVAARQRLWLRMGLAGHTGRVSVIAPDAGRTTHRKPLGSVIKAALALRPDMRAAEVALESAAARAGWKARKPLGRSRHSRTPTARARRASRLDRGC